MRFTNAYSGVSKIRTAQILSIIVATIGLLVTIMSATLDVNSIGDNPSGSIMALVGAIAILGLAMAVLSIIALIMTIGGINRASKDEPIFKTALAAVIVNIVAAAVGAAIQDDPTVSHLISVVNSVAQMLAAYFVVRGIMNLADQLSDEDMVADGKRTLTLILVTFAAGVAFSIIGNFFSNATAPAASVLLIAAAVLLIAQYVVYLVYLGKAKRMLV